MDINEMTRKQFKELPYVNWKLKCDVDGIVLIPSRRHHDSGYNYYTVVVYKDDKAIGKVSDYDTFSIFMDSDWNRVGIDCLRGSGLMRIFLPPNEYEVIAGFHEIRRKGE